jgi:steroid delta-isomerase
MDITHPAATAALTAMNAVTASDRDTWRSCYADDAVLYDPVGGSPLDPQGAGIRGHDALRNFWQQAIAPNQVRCRRGTRRGQGGRRCRNGHHTLPQRFCRRL